MKRIIGFLILGIILFSSCGEYVPNARDKATEAQKDMSNVSIATVPIPTVSYFQERRTIARWAERWDQPNLPCYVYLLSFGVTIGYYVTDGKPASTQSYLMPEEDLLRYSSNTSGYVGSGYVVSTPDIDGTYGNNNPGIRFFTAEGAAVEWGGYGACYLYSDVPPNLNVPKLSRGK